MATLVEQNLSNWPDMNEHNATDMPSSGVSPWGDTWPLGVWCWDETADQVLLGTCPDDAEIVTYQEALRRKP